MRTWGRKRRLGPIEPMIYRQGPAPAGSCPRCRETLIVAKDEPGMRYCEKCGGVFADAAASRRIVSSLDRALLALGFDVGRGKPRDARDERRVACPECLVEMQKVRVEAAVCDIDACPTHGTWFDAGELEDVMRAFHRARQQGARTPGAPPAAYTPSLGQAKTSGDGDEYGRGPGEMLLALLSALVGDRR
jgi:Zn-finger nucleic acid-binding protein